MAQPADPAFRQHLQALADKYRASIPQRMAAIATALAGAGTPPAPAELEALHESLHVVAGSAGSFGFPVLGEQARRLEQLVRQVMAGDAAWEGVPEQVRAYLDWAANDPQGASFCSHD